GRHGEVTRQSQEAGCSRQAAYAHAHRVQQAVSDAHQGGPAREELLREVHQLRADNGALWAWLEQTIDFPQTKQERFAAAAAAGGVSVRLTVTLLAILLPGNACPSRATV